MTVTVRTIDLDPADPAIVATLSQRSAVPDPDVVAVAAAIVRAVEAGGDAALRDLSERFGGALADGTVRVPPDAIAAAPSAIPAAVTRALSEAITNVTSVHRGQRPLDERSRPTSGVLVERLWTPLASVGVYVPGGRGLYPSSLIMGVVPARVAGVERVVVATPASADGVIDPVVLAAASMLGVDEVLAIGGAQAIAALAHGTESIRPVDKIVGPGGPWVTAAKMLVLGRCGIDLPAGPSEAAVVVDDDADPTIAAADVMCQAEHGDESAILLVATSRAMVAAIMDEINATVGSLSRSDTIVEALTRHAVAVVAPTIEDALCFANAWAPEHLTIHTRTARAHADLVPNAGSVFVGHWTPEAAGDYATGANHVLPTGGLARAYGPLAVEDFGSYRQVQTLDRHGLETLAPTITTLADAEGFTAHAHSVRIRMASSPDGTRSTMGASAR